MADAARKLKANRRLEGRPCGWCNVSFALGDDAAICNACAAEQHATCWDQRGGCSGNACANAPLKRLDGGASSGPAAGASRPDPYAPTFSNQTAPPGTFGAPSRGAYTAGGAVPGGGARGPAANGYKFCTGCGNQVLLEAQVCDFCNAILTPDGIYRGPVINAPGAVQALVFGILGLLICGFIFGAVAISKSREAQRNIAANPRFGGGGMATAGFVLGIIDIIAWVIILFIKFSSR